jgi:hypothetical protein
LVIQFSKYDILPYVYLWNIFKSTKMNY